MRALVGLFVAIGVLAVIGFFVYPKQRTVALFLYSLAALLAVFVILAISGNL